MRIVLSLIFAGIIAYALILFWIDQSSSKSYQAEREHLPQDPFVASLITEGTAHCRSPVQSSSYIWACGATLRINGPTGGDFCSTEDSPRYTGELVEGGYGIGYSATWSGFFKEPLSEMIRCEGPQGQIDPACVRMDIFGDDTFETPDNQALAAALTEPDFSKPGERSGEYAAWTGPQNAAVRHGYSVFIGVGNKPPPHACSLLAHHPTLPLMVNLAIPCDRRSDWKAILDDAFLGLERSLVRLDEKARCDMPPEGVRFNVNKYSDQVTVLRDWARQKAQTGQP